MAELNVQPKKKTSVLPWIVLILGAIALIWFLSRNKDKTNKDTVQNTTTDSTTTATTNNTASTGAHTGDADWSGIDFGAPSVQYEEVTNRDIETRGSNNYAIYGLGERILFDEGKATIRSDAENNLKQVANSINKRYNGGEVRVYGYTDAQGDAAANKELAQQRADAVKTWLQRNGINGSRISVNAIGEAKPAASNSTEQGRQQNRRVEIVARSNKS
ncbi:MAG: rane protein [Ferruginibacter sp.]|nr:rane protein [Ferruginibacter sp.]